MYKHCLHHLPSSEKPKLNPRCMQKRNQLANKLLGIDFKQCMFIGKANERPEYSKESC